MTVLYVDEMGTDPPPRLFDIEALLARAANGEPLRDILETAYEEGLLDASRRRDWEDRQGQ